MKDKPTNKTCRVWGFYFYMLNYKNQTQQQSTTSKRLCNFVLWHHSLPLLPGHSSGNFWFCF